MNRIILSFILIAILSSCNKSAQLTTTNFEKFLLSGSGDYHNAEHTWSLDSLVINGTTVNLNPIQKLYAVTYYSNGTFADSDGYTGKWDFTNIDELTIFNKNVLTGTYTPIIWKIIDINSFKFSYAVTTSNNTKYEYYFKIVYN